MERLQFAECLRQARNLFPELVLGSEQLRAKIIEDQSGIEEHAWIVGR